MTAAERDELRTAIDQARRDQLAASRPAPGRLVIAPAPDRRPYTADDDRSSSRAYCRAKHAAMIRSGVNSTLQAQVAAKDAKIETLHEQIENGS